MIDLQKLHDTLHKATQAMEAAAQVTSNSNNAVYFLSVRDEIYNAKGEVQAEINEREQHDKPHIDGAGNFS